MSIRWMAVQYVGEILRLPVINEGDMNKPFGSSSLEREVKYIIVNPFSDDPQVFVPKHDNIKLLNEKIDAYNEMRVAQLEADQLQAECNQLKEENLKLRQELAIRKESAQEEYIEYLRQENVDWEDTYRRVAAENDRWREYNARLRELVRDAAILLGETCDTYFEDEYHEIVNRMHELEVEADGWATLTRHKRDKMSWRTLTKSSSTSSTGTC